MKKFVTIERLNDKTIAESKAKISESKSYALWVEAKPDQRGKEIHFQQLDRDFIPPDDEDLIRTVSEQVLGDYLFIGNDGHAVVGVKRWRNPDGELVGAEELTDRLLKIL